MELVRFLLLLMVALPAYGYVPDINMILDRTVKNQGNSLYAIDLELSIDSKTQTYLAHEHWLIDDADTLRVKVTGEKDLKDKLKLVRIYNKNMRYFMEENGAIKSNRIPDSFFEPIFHIRTVKRLQRTLLDEKILPPSFLKAAKPITDLKEPNYVRPPYIRLARAGGVPTYFLGNVAANETNPAIWIEQDQFVIRKLRLHDQTEVLADEYQRYANNLAFPQVRTIKWPGGSAKIRVLNVKTFPATPKIKELFTTKSFIEERQKNENLNTLPDDPVLKEFYSRYR